MIAFADLYPSLLSLMGFQKEIPETVQTFDLSRHILGKNKKEVVQPYYYVQFDNHATGYRGLRTSTHTFAVHATNGKIDETVLYDRTKDPYQMVNIAGQTPPSGSGNSTNNSRHGYSIPTIHLPIISKP